MVTYESQKGMSRTFAVLGRGPYRLYRNHELGSLLEISQMLT